MTTKTIYRFEKDGSIFHSTIKPEGEYTEKIRLIADENKLLTEDNIDFYPVVTIDLDEVSNWSEVDEPEIEVPEEDLT